MTDPLADLARTWAEQPTEEETGLMAAPSTTIASEMLSAYKKDRRRLIWLSFQEGIPAIAVAAFIWFVIAPEAELTWLALLCGVVPLAVVAYGIGSSIAQERRASQWGNSTRDVIARRLDQVEHRAAIYRNTLWWYFLPLGVMVVLLIFSMEGEIPWEADAAMVFGLIGVVFAALYAVNRLIGKVKYDPEQVRLRQMLDDLDDEV